MNLTFLRNIAITLTVSSVVIYIIYHTYGSGAYLTMSALALSAFLMGYLEPHKGWALALVQISVLMTVHFLKLVKPVNADLAMFATFAGPAFHWFLALLQGV